MSLVTINIKPTEKQLNDFGTASAIMLAVIAVLLHWLKGLSGNWALFICALGLLIYLLSRINTHLVRPVYLGLILITFPIGWIISFIVMAVFYFLILTPVGILFKLIKRDPLHRTFDRTADSYWVPHRTADSVKRYFNQF